MKRILTLLTLVSLVSVLSIGCGIDESETETTAQQATESAMVQEEEVLEEIYIPVIGKGFQQKFWQAVKKGALQASIDYGVSITFEGPEAETMVDVQLQMIEAALERDPSALCLAALDSKAVIPLVQKATDAGIPVIGFDSGVDSDLVVTTAATDNYAAGMLAADKMADLIDNEGKVALVVHDEKSRSGRDRRDGFVERIEEKFPGIEVVDIRYGEGDELKSTELAKEILSAHRDLSGFFGSNEGSITGILIAMKELQIENNVVVIGFDAGKEQMDAIRSGLQAGAIIQDPIGIGYKAVEAAVKVLNGEVMDLKSIQDSTGMMQIISIRKRFFRYCMIRKCKNAVYC